MIEYDFLAIGGGSGGIAAAARAASYGAKAAVIESRSVLGGTCVNVGCVPKKIMWYASQIADAIKLAPDYGFNAKRGELDWQQLVSVREKYISNIHQFYRGYFERLNIDKIEGQGEFVDSHTIRVGDQTIKAKYICIATGAQPSWPTLPGAEFGIDSDGFFALTQQPKRVAVVGAGYIAVELAGLLNGLGSEVTLVLRKEIPLREFDSMLSQSLLETMQKEGIKVETTFVTEALSKQGNSLNLKALDGRQLAQLDSVVWAIGRNPNSAGIGLDKANISTDQHGFILVDEWQQVSGHSHIFAIGDVTGAAQLTPVAIKAGRLLADRLFAGKKEAKVDYSLIPTVVFSHPAIATIGLTEAQAEATYGRDQLKIYESGFTPMLSAVTQHRQGAKMKLITVGDNEKIIGLHSIGTGSDELLQGFAVAMAMGATKADFDATIAIHPTSAEEFVTMR